MSECVNALVAEFAGFRDSVTRALDALWAKLDDRGRTPWGHMWSAMGVLLAVLTTVGGLALLPMGDGQAKLEAAIEKFSDHVVTEKEFATFIGNTKDRRDDAQRANEDRFRRAEADLDRLQSAIVPRGEHEQRWNSQGQRDGEIQRQVDDLRGRMEGIYSPKDQIQSMQRHIEDLEAARARR